MDERFQQAHDNLMNINWATSLDDAAQYTLEEYVLSAPNMGRRFFEHFLIAFSQCVVNNSKVNFYSAEIALARRSQEQSSYEPEFFDEVNQQLFLGDAQGLTSILTEIGKSCPKHQRLPKNFDKKFRSFLAKQIQCHSFSNSQITSFLQTLTTEFPNSELNQIYNSCANDIRDIKKRKIERDICELNKWAFDFKSNDLLKKLSFRNTYINLAYELLVKEHEIKSISPEKYYQNHRIKIQKEIRNITGALDKKGKKICRKYAINKVYKAVSSSDTFKFEAVLKAMKKNINEDFYEECQVILKAIEGGRKHREVNIPQKPFPIYEH